MDTSTHTWLGRMVVFGDSVPYGHGLVLPSLDNPPSQLAYPQLVRDALGGLQALSYRTDACGLFGDQLAVSGAPSIANRWTSGDSTCGVAVFPDEVYSAGLQANPPALVTIQAGADDINFPGCLESLVGVPAQFGAEKCVTENKKKGFSLTPKVQSELASLTSGITATINRVHQAAPHARIVLLDYYQILPAGDAPLTGHSALCTDLQASRRGGEWRTTIRATADYLQGQLNNTMASVAGQCSDVVFVDIGSLFSGHEMCTTDTWLFDGIHDAAHPTATGQQEIADAVVTYCTVITRRCVGRP